MSRKDITIGLFGFGCVGNGLYEVLERTPGLKARIKKICVKDRTKQRSIPEHHFTFDKNELLNDPEINVIVELIDDAEAAFDIVRTGLVNGKAVVSANKKMIAEHFAELRALQNEYNVPLLYEAACCASIPIIRNLEEYYDNDLLESIEGIVNGSTNYILTKTVDENLSYEEALADAQQKGYAESDPTLDTGGFDSKYKLLILLAHAFGIVVEPDHILNLGIDRLSNLELSYAKEKGLKIKLVAQAFKDQDGKVSAFVLPKFVDKDDKLFSVDDVFNGVKTKSCFSDTQFFCGKGAGAFPTASAVLSDISALSYDYRYEYKKMKNAELKFDTEELRLKVFLRHAAELPVQVNSSFEQVYEVFRSHRGGYVIGVVLHSKLKELLEEFQGELSVVLFEVCTNETALKEVQGLLLESVE